MYHSVQSLHRLPVLNYDISRNGKAPEIEENYHAYTINNVKKNRSRRKRAFDVGAKLSNNKIKVNEQKYQLRRKSASLKNIKEKLSIFCNYTKGHVQPINSSQCPKNKKQKSTSKPSNEIKVLFSSDSCKKNKRRKINQDFIHDIYDLEDNFIRNNFKNELNEPHNIINCEVLKKHKQSTCKSFALNDLKHNYLRNSSSTPSYGCNIPTHYKVVNFPSYDVTDVELEEINFKGGNLNNCQCETKDEIGVLSKWQCQNENAIGMPKVEKVASTTIKSQRGGGDYPTVGNQCELKEVCIKSEQPENDPKLKQNCCNTFKILYDPIMLHENVIYLAKRALKFIIFALALIIWSPCIVAIFFCWVVTYPLQPKYIHRNLRCKSKPSMKIHVHGSKNVIDSSIQTCQDINISSPFTRGINWALHSIALSLGVFKSLLHLGRNDQAQLYYPPLGRYGNKRRVMTSNPKNKYTLYYNRNKGWVMKSTQRNRRDKSSQYRKKSVRTVASEPYCGKFHNKYAIGVNASNWTQTHVARRSQSYPRHSMPCSLPCCCHNRHRHLCTNTSSLPVRVKLSKPVYNKTNLKRRAYSKYAINQTRKPMLPQQHLYKSFIKQGPTIRFSNKLYRYCKKTVYNINRVIDDVETEIWKNDTSRGGTYGLTLRRRPCFFVYKICPSLYPLCQITYKLYTNLCRFLLLVISGCIWCPLLGFCYMCYAAFCRTL